MYHFNHSIIDNYGYKYNYGYRITKIPDVKYTIIGKKKHIFYDPKNRYYVPLTSMTSLAKMGSEESIDNYAEVVDKFLASKYASPPIGIKANKIKLDIKKVNDYYSHHHYLSVDGKFIEVRFSDVYFDYKKKLGYKLSFDKFYKLDGETITEVKYGVSPEGMIPIELKKEVREYPDNRWRSNESKWYYTEEQLKTLDWYQLKMETESGHKFKITEYQNL